MAAPVALPIWRFNSGEITPNLRGRADLDWYGASLEILENAIARPEGPATMRTGTWHAGSPRVPIAPIAGTVKLLPFVVGVDPLVAYMVEATDLKLRFWNGIVRTLVPDPANPLLVQEVVSPWKAADLPLLKTVQSADTMWIMHPSYRTQKLTRTGAVGGPYTFALAPVSLSDGPYYAQNTTATTLTASVLTVGAGATLTASANLFDILDVGRVFRQGNGTAWGWGVITGFTSATVVTVTINRALPVSGNTIWRLGLYSDRTGWPSCGDFHQERLYYGSRPSGSFARIDGSCVEDFDNFAPDTVQATGATAVLDTNAVAYVVATNDLAVIRSMVSNRSLMAMTSSTEMEYGSWQDTSALTPSRPPIVRPASREGSPFADALSVHDNILFINRFRRSLHEMAYDFAKNGMKTREISIRASHLGDRSPFVGAIWANRPWNLVWLWADDGSLTGCTYTPEQTIIAFSHHVLGGFLGNSPGASVESLAVMPGATADEVWFCCRRTVNGQEVRQIGTFADALHESEPQDLACYVDQAATARGSQPAANLTFTVNVDGTVNVAADAAVLAGSVGKRIIAVQADGRDFKGAIQWSRVQLEVTTVTDAQHVICIARSDWLPASLSLASGQWYFGMTSMGGLGHLVGQTVAVLADGAPLAQQTVKVDGTIDITPPAAIVTAGLPYTMIVQPVEQEGGGRQGASSTRIKTSTNVGLKLVRSGPFRAGAPDNLFDFDLRTGADDAGQAVPLYNGAKVIEASSGDDGRTVRWRLEATGPLPVTIASATEHRMVGEGVP